MQTVRLVGGSCNSNGRVEIYHDGEWGTVCDDGWDISDANVVCKSLGLSNATWGGVRRGAHFGEGSGKIWLDDVACTGEESNLEDCGHIGWESHNCGHGEDAGVECGECPGNYKPF